MRAIIAGALVGLLLGSAIGGEFSVLGAISGALVGGYFFRSRQPARMTPGELERRLLELEKSLAEQRSELELLHRLVVAPGESVAAAPVAPTAEPTPPSSTSAARDTTVSPPVAGDEPGGRWVDVDALLEPRKPSSGFRAAAPRSEPETADARPDPMAAYLKTTLGIAGDHLAIPGWLKWFWETNPLAKIGIVLLFFGVASGLRLAIDHGLLPVPVRLIATAVAGIALIAFGMTKVRVARHRVFGLALQGGGFALLYLVGYFMLTRYALIGQGLAFAAFATLGVGCVALAARQDGPALAVLGLSGAFLAPVLASGSAQMPLPLFLYFALLNAFILGIDWFRAWRVLNIAGFVFTLAVVLFLAAYSAMPVATALFRAPGSAGWQDGMLLFGTPLVGCFLQAQLVGDTAYGLAWSALAGSLWYLMLWWLIVRRAGSASPTIAYAHFGIAAFLATVAVPLAFDAQVTSAFWAAEGAAVLWYGVRMRRMLAQVTGLGKHFGVVHRAGCNSQPASPCSSAGRRCIAGCRWPTTRCLALLWWSSPPSSRRASCTGSRGRHRCRPSCRWAGRRCGGSLPASPRSPAARPGRCSRRTTCCSSPRRWLRLTPSACSGAGRGYGRPACF